MWRTGPMPMDPSLAGILMNDFVGLGESDADSRWIGVKRHQAVLALVGFGLISDWILRSSSSPLEVLVGIALATTAVPIRGGETIGQYFLAAVLFTLRSPWSAMHVVIDGTGTEVNYRSTELVQGFALRHRGRLDLSGSDIGIAERLSDVVRALGARGVRSHISVHVIKGEEGALTLLALPESSQTPEGWWSSPDLVRRAVGLDEPVESMDLLERWTYMRASQYVFQVLRIRDFTAAPSDRAVLERLQSCSTEHTISLHLEVVGGTKAQRIAGRAVHRMGSDGEATRAVGFRRSARAVRSLERVAQREAMVASGQALLRLAVYVLVRAKTLSELHLCVNQMIRAGEESGLCVDRGSGRQAQWYGFQLPGGVNW